MQDNLQVSMDEFLPLRDVVFNTLRQAILTGELKPGERLMEIHLAKKLGVSRTPIREAIRKLELEGLVHIIPNRGAYVNTITAKDVQDIYIIRSMLEGICVRWATKYITEEQLEDLEETLCLSEYHTKKGNYEKLYELDGLFHEQLYCASNSRILNHVLSDFHDYVKRVRKATLASQGRSVKSTEEHRAIFEAVRARDAEKAEELAKVHIRHTIECIKGYGLEKIL